jgi:transposase
VSDLRAVNARLRQVVADKDELIVAQSEQLSNQDERLRLQAKRVDTQADQIDTQGELLAAQAELIKRLQEEMAELPRQLGKSSSNSSTPPSKDSIAAKAKRRADRSSRVRSKDRKRGGQPGHQGSGLVPTPDPDHTERVAPPEQCRDCHADLGGAAELGDGWAQVWDVAPAVLDKAHYQLPRRKCGCGTVTTSAAPFGQAGTVSYGPNLNAAAICARQRRQRTGGADRDADPHTARSPGLGGVRRPRRRTAGGQAGHGRVR